MKHEKDLIYFIALINGIDFLEKNDSIKKCIHNYSIDINEWGSYIDRAGQLTLGIEEFSIISYLKDKSVKPLVSLLHNIKKSTWNDQWVLPAKKETIDKTNFAIRNTHELVDISSLIDGFNQELNLQTFHSLEACISSVMELIKVYFSNIPVTYEENDISLYDFLRMRAAIALCLYETKERTDGVNFQLVGADFSGIQSFIYQIVSKYAAKNLKGRSYYLRLLSDAVVRKLLHDMQLSKMHIIYNSGGGFYLLMPNNACYNAILEQSIIEIEQSLFKSYKTSLYVAIDKVEVSQEVLLHNADLGLSDIWAELFDKRDQKKSTRFASIIQEDYDAFFEPFDQGGESLVDAITGEELLETDKVKLHENMDSKVYVSKSTAKQIELGKLLKEIELVVVAHEALGCLDFLKITCINPAELDVYYYFLSPLELESVKHELNEYDGIEIVSYNQHHRQAVILENSNISFTSSYYGGTEYDMPRHLTFEEMTDDEQFVRLGILRMDVDNLGSIFQQGIIESKANLCRYAQLSRSFDYFFSGYLNTIWRQDIHMNESFIIYSGGDDVFIVGKWNTTIDIAKQISDDFEAYTCYNEAFSISGGVATVKPKFPIMKGAEMSAQEESRSKSHVCGSFQKNAFSFMSVAMHWKNEYPQVKNLKDNIVKYCGSSESIINHSFIGKLLMHYENAHILNHKVTNYRIYWLLVYDLGRMKQRLRNNQEAVDFIDTCIKEVSNGTLNTLNHQGLISNYHPLELWALAARWAELEIRTINTKL